VTGERFALSFNTSAAIGGPAVETPPAFQKTPSCLGASRSVRPRVSMVGGASPWRVPTDAAVVAAGCGNRHHRSARWGRDHEPHNVTINGRQYRMACEEGQEARLLKLAESLESRIDTLRGKFGEIGDARLVVMAALTVCDELLDATARIRGLEEELDGLPNIRPSTHY
jgi:cell division protein ZapA (FtsZ GTPase activity inhibitor)